MTHSTITTTLSLMLTAALFSSCATVFRGAKTSEPVLITGNPPASKVYINNEYVGQTPLSYTMTKRKEVAVKIEKEGYKDLNTSIETKLNPLWTGISVVGNALLLEIPTIIDYKNGSLSTIVTDSISFDLVKINTSPTAATTSISETQITETNEEIISPAIRIRTSSKELLLKYHTALTVTTKNGQTYKSAIAAIENDYMLLIENNTKVYYSDIVKIRIFNTRRWFPILTSVSLVGPAVWYFSSVVVKSNTSNCSNKIHDIKVINHFEKREFGKITCD